MQNTSFEFPRALALAAALAAIFPAARAQQAPAFDMDPVVITAVAPDSPLTFITNPKTPRQPLPASDGTDYLKTIPGFSAIRNGGTNGDPVLRGMFGSRLNILTNGSSMPGACPARMDAPSSYISPETFDQLTVIKGPQTVLWGPGASAGTVRFDRDTPRFTEAGVRFDGSLTGGSFGRNDQTADFTAGNESVYVRVTGNHSHSQDYKDGNGLRVPSRWDKWNTDLALGFTPDADTLFELTAGTGDGEARYAGRGMDGSKFKRESFGLRFEKRNLGATLEKIEAQLYYNYADHVMDNYTLRRPDPNGPMPMAMAADVDRATWGGRVAATLKLADALSMTGGLDFQQSRHRGRSGTDTNSYRNQSWEKDAEFSNVGLFSELTWRASERGRLIGGARVDRASAKDFRPTSGHMMMMPNPTAGERRDSTLPSGFLRYEQDLESLPATWYVGLGHVQRFPDYWELFSPGMGPAGSVNAFDAIKPEKTTQLDVGMQYRGDKVDAWVSGYAGYVRDFILFDYRPGGMMGPTSQASNVNARIAGGELGASWKVAPSWTLGATLAYAWGENRSDGRALPQIPPLEAKLSAAYDDGVWSAGALWRLVAPQKRYALNSGNVVGQDFGPSAGFGVFSLNAGYAISKQVKLSLGVDNLFDKAYAEHLNLAGDAGFGFPGHSRVNEPGRSVWARVSVKY
ncbi:TonB-dependent copper receptor [Achromobacter sp. Marseille-Q0513]|uniref:TonB-dependent copper receptor n=1 Tax=Achromobacter sp. Marseille-Q0513 TaxID=2829161 RepID=UPI001B97E9EA|nr:TonB-dependent copper receptor [Achromobacter sp. Marseille-Q0513]MBR8653486.1 TonB-dependent copper receptor [Achromobacter sp. Marseille-Q0513]